VSRAANVAQPARQQQQTAQQSNPNRAAEVTQPAQQSNANRDGSSANL